MSSEIECRQDDAEVKLGLAAEILRSRCAIRLRALGTSMLPAIWPGDVLVIEHCHPSEIQPGDIIGFMQEGRWLIHRVWKVVIDFDKLSFVTRGDSLAHEDSPVLPSELLGRVAAIHRNGHAFFPGRHVSRMALWVGRTLQRFDSLRGLVLQLRSFLDRYRETPSGLAKAWR